MSSELVKKEDTKITLKLTADAAKFDEAINKAYNKIKSKINIQGFRKGKAPRYIIEKYYGVEVFYDDALEFVFPEIYEAALKEHNINPIDYPEIDIQEVNKGEDVIFTVVVEVMPEVEVKDYKGIEVEKKEYNVLDEDLEKEIDSLREQNARMIAVEDREVKEGDMVIIDYKGMVDGVAFDGGTAERHSLTIGSGQFIPGFEDQLVGKNIGEEVKVEVTFPEEYHSEDLAGQDAIFEVIIHEIKEKELPELDDEFAKDVSEFDTLEEFKNSIKERLEKEAESRADQQLRSAVVTRVVDTVDVEIPEPAVERQVDNMIMDFEYRLQFQGMNLDTYLQMTGMTLDTLKSMTAADAARVIKEELVLLKIADLEEITASDEDLEKEFEKLAAQYNQSVEDVKKRFREKDIEAIKEDLTIVKTVDFLVENAKQI